MERLISAIDYIMPLASPVRRSLLLPYLTNRPLRPISPTAEFIESITQPPADLDSSIRFNYSYNELVKIAKKYTQGTTEDIKRVFRYAMVWSGLKLGDEESLRWATLDHGYESSTRLPRVIVPIDGKRLSIRVVPNSWENSFASPFSMHRESNGMQISATDSSGRFVEIASPRLHYLTESVETLAYIKNMEDGTISLTVNPLQKCPQECEFCCRAYYDMTKERKSELINLSPEEMAKYLKVKFGYIGDWSKISEIAIITGEFTSDEAILRYVEEFVGHMDSVTSGKWNPIKNSHQEITVSTHLLQTEDSMLRAKKSGMKHFLHTIEMVDVNREEIMHVAGKEFKSSFFNKGHSSFSGILNILQTAIKIFGPDNVEPALVIGLDPANEAIRAMGRLKTLGITNISRALLNVYNVNQFRLMHTPFEDTVFTMQYANNLFKSTHNRIIQNNSATSNKGELFS